MLEKHTQDFDFDFFFDPIYNYKKTTIIIVVVKKWAGLRFITSIIDIILWLGKGN